MPLNPAPVTDGQRRLLLYSCAGLIFSGVVAIGIGAAQGQPAAFAVGVLALLVSALVGWLYRNCPRRPD